MTLPKIEAPDLGAARGLSVATLKAFHVSNNGTGWEYEYQTNGVRGKRWKAYDSASVPKYRFVPSKPDGGDYFYPVGVSLTDAISAAQGQLYLVGGEMGVMAMWEAGIRCVTCTFGDAAIPDTLAADLAAWRVAVLYLIPDRDDSGLKWAVKVRDALLASLDIQLEVVQLPYPLESAHGKDINDYWLEQRDKRDTFRTALASLPLWRLPEPEPAAPPTVYTDAPELPARFLDAVERALGDCGGFNGEGWSKKHVRCPFHDDSTPSANWNNQLHILRCQSTCGKSYLAKETGAALNIHLKDYLDSTPRIPLSPAPALKIVEKPAPVEAPSPTPAAPAKAPEKRLAPPLPSEAVLTTAQEAEAARGRVWLDDYVRWAGNASPLTPDIFHEATALWLLATVSTRRMKVRIGGENIFPNLYVLIVAGSSVYHKTTGMKAAWQLLTQARLDSLLLPTDVTPEALFDELAGVKPANFEALSQETRTDWLKGRMVAAQRSIMKDECSSIFAALKRDYMAGLTELLLQGYDGEGKLTKLIKSKGLIVVRDMCLSFFGATTPPMYAKHVGSEEIENGFIARFAVVTPDVPPIWKDVDNEVDVPPRLVTRLRALFEDVLPWHGGSKPSASITLGDVVAPPVASVSLTPDALSALKRYRKAVAYDLIVDGTISEEKTPSYLRIGTMAYKVAMLLAAIDTTETPIRIEACHAYAAQDICEKWRESLHRLERLVAKAAYSGIDDKVLDYIRSTGDVGATLREVKRNCGVKDKDVQQLEKALTALHEAGLIEKRQREHSGAGRPTIAYFAVGKE